MRTALLTALAMLAFAGNSLLCRMALKLTAVDPASFTSVRLVSGAVALWLLVRLRGGARTGNTTYGNWGSALALFAYAALFSYAYVGMTAATGALLLFGAVQASMIGWGLAHGERLRPLQTLGFVAALAGLAALMLPGFATPQSGVAVAMLSAGVAWGVYSLRGKATTPGQAADPLATTCGNFVRTVPMALALSAVALPSVQLDAAGLALAVASGAVTSGLGYAVWYRALPALQATQAATVQLSVPVIAAVGGVLILGEGFTWQLLVSSVAILGGIALVMRKPAA
ncbi:MAG: DMT family transporter [Burkholderiales bacterium]|nr:DMT family transporter [Burkholderiales bacterium]